MTNEEYKNKIIKSAEEDKIGLTGVWLVIYWVIAIALTIYSIVQLIIGPGKRPRFDMGDDRGPRYQFGHLATTVTNELPVPVLYGTLKVAGNIIYQSEQEELGAYESKMYRAISICEGEISAITEVKVNDVEIDSLPGCSSTQYLGTPEQDVDERISGKVFGVRHLCYSACTLQTSDDLRTGNPNHTFIVNGLKVKTWNGAIWSTEKTFTRNPVACVRDFLTNTRYGLGIAETDIDDASFGVAYDFCNELVPNTDTDESEVRAYLDFIIDARKPGLDIIQTMLDTFLGFLIVSGNTIKIGVEGTQSVSQAFDLDSIMKSSFGYTYISKDETPNRVRVQYIDPEYDYSKVLTYAEDKIDQDDRLARGLGEHIVEQDIELLGITRFSQASRIANLYLYLAKLTACNCSFEVSIEALAAEIGDIVTITHDAPYWTEKPFRIMSIELTDTNTLKLSCREYNASIYSDNPGSGITRQTYGSPPNPLEAPNNVTSLSLNEVGWRNTDGTHIANVDITWTQPNNTQYLAGYKIQYSQDGEDYQDAGYVQVGNNVFRYNNADVGSEYQFKVFTISQEDLMSSGTTSSLLTIVGKDDPPANATEFNVNQLGESLLFTWLQPDEPDVEYYEIRTGVSWSSGTIIKTLIYGTQFQYFNIALGTSSFWLKAVDRSGNYAVTAVGAQITVSSIPNQNILATQDEHTSWSGDHTQTQVSGTNLALDFGFLTGNYVSTAMDLGEITQSKVTTDYTVTTSGIDAWDSSATAAFDSYSDLTWTGFQSPTNASVAFDISLSDNSADWTDWETLQYADYTARYLKIKTTLTRSDINDELLMSTLTINADVPDVIDTGVEQSVATPTGTYVIFNESFHTAPSVSIAVFNEAGDFQTPIMTARTNVGFTVKLMDETPTEVEGKIDWKAIGY